MEFNRRSLLGSLALLGIVRPARDIPEGGPGVYASTPHPIRTRLARVTLSSGVVTSIMRHWRPGDSGKGGRCRLCPECHAYQDGCLIVVGAGITRAEAPLYSSHGNIIQKGGGA